jgi:hypothetical protein
MHQEQDVMDEALQNIPKKQRGKRPTENENSKTPKSLFPIPTRNKEAKVNPANAKGMTAAPVLCQIVVQKPSREACKAPSLKKSKAKTSDQKGGKAANARQ